jgi:hypothetical protein
VLLQGGQAPFAITLKVIADGFSINQQGFRNPGNRPTLAEQVDGFNPVGITLVGGMAVFER